MNKSEGAQCWEFFTPRHPEQVSVRLQSFNALLLLVFFLLSEADLRRAEFCIRLPLAARCIRLPLAATNLYRNVLSSIQAYS